MANSIQPRKLRNVYLIVGKGAEGAKMRQYAEESGMRLVVIESSSDATPYLVTPEGDYRGVSMIRQLIKSLED